MSERLDFRKLRYVVAVAQMHSLTAAAKLLCISQPALTRCISEVEEDLGGPGDSHHPLQFSPR